MRQLHEEQELRKRVVLAREAIRQPALGDGQHLREQPALDLRHEPMRLLPLWPFLSVVPEVLLERQLGEQELDLR